MRVIDRDELDVRVHHGGDEGDVTRQAVELGDTEASTAATSACRQRLLQLRTVIALAGLDLGVFGDQRAADTGQVALYGFPLCFEAESRSTLFIGRNPVIGDELRGLGLHGGLSNGVSVLRRPCG